MYLQDAKDHLNLAKAILENNYRKMLDASSLDTSSRELIDDKLWDFLRSEEFFKNLENEKKQKNKNKP